MSTQLYLIRHGIAAQRGTYAHDDDRPLTEVGRRKTAAIATRLHQLSLRFDQLLTSPLVRAQQTAVILHQAALGPTPEICDALQPGGNLGDWLPRLTLAQGAEAENVAIAVVGHEPDLSQWAQQLVGGGNRRAEDAWILKKGGIIGLQVPTENAMGRSQLFWLCPPRLLL